MLTRSSIFHGKIHPFLLRPTEPEFITFPMLEIVDTIYRVYIY